MKKKLLITVGAGASLEFGMPSVSEIDRIFSKCAHCYFSLADDCTKNLYSFIRNEIDLYYKKCLKNGLRKNVNYEEVLYQIFMLCGSLSGNNHSFASNALFSVKELPDIFYIKKKKKVDSNVLHHLASHLVDSLIGIFINRCEQIKRKNGIKLLQLEKFLKTLTNTFDIGIISLNHDNVFTQAKPDLYTGFEIKSGTFNLETVINNTSWNFIYHLHGSIHFSMEGDSLDMHAIKWNEKPCKNNKTSSKGRNMQDSMEGIPYLISSIIAGYGKLNQILRPPFINYYSQLHRLVNEADSFLFLGYGFSDIHLNSAFHTIRNRTRPVLIIDYADDDQVSLQFRNDIWTINLLKTIPTNGYEMSDDQYSTPANIGELKKKKDFEISKNPKSPLAVWYGGMIDACKNADKIIEKLH